MGDVNLRYDDGLLIWSGVLGFLHLLDVKLELHFALCVGGLTFIGLIGLALDLAFKLCESGRHH